MVRRNPSSSTYTTYIVLILRLYLLLNLWFALRPLLRSRTNDDTISDIPLTPSQRALMGLPLSPSPAKRIPHGASPMPSSNTSSPAYVTPPRYKRTSFSSSSSPIGGSNPALMTSTPNSFRSVSANYSPTTPLSDRKGFTQADLSPFRSISPNTRRARSSSGSPLFQKAIVNNNRTDNGSPAFQTSFSPSSPSPIGLRRSQSVREGTEGKSRSRSPALNYKWLYEKEMRNPIAVAGGGLLPRSESIPF